MNRGVTLCAVVCPRLGTVPVAAHQVLYQLWVLASFVVDSLAIAGQTLVATALGQGQPRRAREMADRLIEVPPAPSTLQWLRRQIVSSSRWWK